MLFGDFSQVHINDLASLEIFVEEMENDEFCLGNERQELLLGNFSVLTVSSCHVLLMLSVLGFDIGKSFVPNRSHNVIIAFRVEI